MNATALLQQYLLPYSRYADDQLSFSKRGWADASIPASPKVDPFIYGGRSPSRTGENLTDEEIADAIKTRDIAISPGGPNFGFTAPRMELHDDLRQMMALGRQTDNGRGFGGNDISLTGTQWELTLSRCWSCALGMRPKGQRQPPHRNTGRLDQGRQRDRRTIR